MASDDRVSDLEAIFRDVSTQLRRSGPKPSSLSQSSQAVRAIEDTLDGVMERLRATGCSDQMLDQLGSIFSALQTCCSKLLRSLPAPPADHDQFTQPASSSDGQTWLDRLTHRGGGSVSASNPAGASGASDAEAFRHPGQPDLVEAALDSVAAALEYVPGTFRSAPPVPTPASWHEDQDLLRVMQRLVGARQRMLAKEKGDRPEISAWNAIEELQSILSAQHIETLQYDETRKPEHQPFDIEERTAEQDCRYQTEIPALVRLADGKRHIIARGRALRISAGCDKNGPKKETGESSEKTGAL